MKLRMTGRALAASLLAATLGPPAFANVGKGPKGLPSPAIGEIVWLEGFSVFAVA